MTTDRATASAPASPVASAATLAPMMLASVMVGVAVAIGVANLRGWSPGAGGMGVEESAVAGAAGVGLGAVLGLAILWPASSRVVQKLGLMVLAASTVRMLASLSAVVAVLFLASPEVYTFLTALCVAFVMCLAVESAWAVSALRRDHARHLAPRPNPTLTPGAVAR